MYVKADHFGPEKKEKIAKKKLPIDIQTL